MSARYWNARLRMRVGDAPYFLHIESGRVVRFDDQPTGSDPYEILIAGSVEDWAELLAAVPRPFYQDIWGASSRHGFRLEGDLESLCAYYNAIRRMTDVMRQLRRREE